MTDVEARPEDVGQVLVKVQEDIRQLREHLIGKGDGKTISVADFENALRKTEQGLQRQTEEVVHRLNNQVKTLPLGDTLSGQESQVFSFDSSWDPRSKALVHASSSNKLMVRRSGRDLLPRQPLPPGQRLLLRERVQIQGPSKGQEMRNQNLLRAVFNPLSQANRPVLQENYGIQLPLIPQKPEPRPPPKPVTGTTVDHLTVLPKANRVDAQLAPPPISEEDARKGIMSLIERGLIPPAANLTLDPSPVRHKLARLHDPQDKMKPMSLSDMQSSLAGIKLDMRTSTSQPTTTTALESSIPKMPAPQRPSSEDQRTYSAKSRDTSTTMQAKTPISVRTYEMPRHPLPPPTTPASGDVKSLSHRFAVQHGRVKDSQPEFLAFKQHYCLTWGSIVTMLKYLERMLTKYAVPVAFINGDKLADLSVEFELEKPPRVQDLLTVIVNREDVEAIINKPGRRYQGPNGVDLAATYIQASWRRFRDRSFYLDFRRKKWAAGVIAISWIMHIKMARVRMQLRQTRLDQLEASRARAKKFAASWDRIKTSKRVVIHIPSLGLSQNIRDSINDFSVRQNSQMARLCDIKDPNVDVIYISPVPMTDETLQYYAKLLGLHDAIESGEVEDQRELPNRYKILVPEAIKSFPTHRMCLSTILKYSPNTMRRLKNLIRGREAFMIPTVPHRDDLAVADFLNVPILAPEPEVAHLYSTKSGCKRIFASANSAMPPGEYDIYSLGQLHECLAQLVTEHLNVKRWLFKLDDEFDGRGIAYCDVTEHLKCYHWACKEAARYGEKWSKKWAQEGAYIKIHAEVPDIVAKHSFPVNTKAYATWEKYLEAFLSQGGVIEACPPSDSITTISVDMFIEPNGRTQILTLGDQIHAESQFSCWGISFPQSSVEPHVLNKQCHGIANACKSRGIVGYFTIDFVTFIDPATMEQELWALDLSLSYSESLAMYQLLGFITRGVLDTNSHQFQVTPPKNAARPRRRRLLGQTEEEPVITNRYAVMSTRLLHTNLGVVHYSVFFQMCRAHGIGYDIKEKQGTVFTLQDSFNRERLGMITVGDNLQGVLATYARNLSVIHQEISAPKMQGTTNFRLAIEDIESILGTTVQNSEEPEEKEKTG